MKKKSYDIKFSKKIKLPPWIGDAYFESPIKILALGESIYEKNPTKNIISYYVKDTINGWKQRFFSAIPYIISTPDHWFEENKEIYNLDADLFWHSIAFYEYIQESLDGPRKRPTNKMWLYAKNVFPEIIEKVQPDIIVAFGEDVYNQTPPLDGKDWKIFKGNGEELLSYIYKINDKNIYICKIKHPSSYGFKIDTWIDLYGKFLDTYKKIEHKK